MITCTLTYRIDPYQLDAFETYAKAWVWLVPKFGGAHHGYFLPHEGANDVAWAMFSFESLAAYEAYRARIADDPDCRAVFDHAARTRCILSYERSFTRPVLKGESPAALGLGAGL
ncbi:MAG: NIPSNAP family protein [Pseudomonadota bacterium]